MITTRTDISSEIDNALSGRNLGARGFWECARGGNGNMMTDLMVEDDRDYTELEGLGEAVEEMTAAESLAEDQGRHNFRPYREPIMGEKPPYAPKPGMAWLRRRIPIQARRPGGKRLVRVRWVQVSPVKYEELRRAGQIQAGTQTLSGIGGLGSFLDLSPMMLAVGVALGLGTLVILRKR
jgi:hypothetical protein